MITKETATDIVMAMREIEASEKLLTEIIDVTKKHGYDDADIRDAFGRRQNGLVLGVPSGESSRRLFNVNFSLAKPVIEAHIAAKQSELVALNEKAKHELNNPRAIGE